MFEPAFRVIDAALRNEAGVHERTLFPIRTAETALRFLHIDEQQRSLDLVLSQYVRVRVETRISRNSLRYSS